MNHDELVAKIDADSDYFDYPDPYRNALRAAVELHKPVYSEFEDVMTYCEGCSMKEIVEYSDCPTIQAIEAELK